MAGSTDEQDKSTGRVDDTAATRPVSEPHRVADPVGLEPLTSTAAVKPGQCLGRYVILRKLAQGGMSVVFVAYDPELNREVALKLMRPGGPEGDERASERLLREAQAMARLSHNNVVHVYDVGVVDGRVYMAMEYVRGETLEQWLKKEPRPWRSVIKTLVGAGRGLAAAHAVGLVHLDFKPRNVLVGDDGEVRVVDFGLARPPRSFDSGVEVSGSEPPAEPELDRISTSGRFIDPITRYGTIMGTPGYMAPEQLAAEGTDSKTDQFAFCVTTWVALYGERPFEGTTSRDLNHNVMAGRIRPPSDRHKVPARIRKLLERGLATTQDARHPSLDVLLDALEASDRRVTGRVAVAVAAMLAVGAGGYVLAAADTGPQCDGGVQMIAGTWDDDHRSAVHAAIAADLRPFAADVADSVLRIVDAWVEGWSAEHRDACEATHVRGEQSAERLDLRMRCLRRHMAELRALRDTLLIADATTVERANEAAARLPSPADCQDNETLTETMAPVDPAREAEIEAAFDRLALAVAQERAGQYPIALLTMFQARLEAEVLAYPPLVVWARQSMAALLSEIGSAEAAELCLLEALLAAEEAGIDGRRMVIEIELSFLVGIHRGQPERAHRHARIASALIKRLGAAPEIRARLHANEGAVYGVEGRPQESIDHYNRALSLLDGEPNIEHSNRGSIHLGLGASYHLKASYDQALSHYERARDLISADLGPRHPKTATVIENMGTAYQAMGRFADAKEQFSIARRIYDEAQVTDALQATLLVGLAAAHEGLEEYEEATRLFERVVEVLSAEGHEVPVLAVAMGNLGTIYVETGRYDDALAVFEEQLPLLRRAAGPNHIYSHYFRACKARALHGLGRFAEAEAIAQQVVDVYADRRQEIDPLHFGEATLVLARAKEGMRTAALLDPDRPPPTAAEVDALVDDARRALLEAGVPGKRPLRRLEAFAKSRRRQKKADPPPTP